VAEGEADTEGEPLCVGVFVDVGDGDAVAVPDIVLLGLDVEVTAADTLEVVVCVAVFVGVDEGVLVPDAV